MAIYRSKPTERYLILSNKVAQDGRLSMKASGLLHYMLSLPEDWGFNLSHLVEHFKQDGQVSIRSGLNELEEFGYLVRKQRRSNGKFAGKDWLVFDIPQISPRVEKTNVDKTKSEKTKSDNRTLQSTEGTNDRGDKQHSGSSGSSENEMPNVYKKAQQVFGLNIRPTDYERLSNYQNDLEAGLMLKAFDIAEKNKAHNIKYVFSILTRWSTNGYHSLNDLDKKNSSTQGRAQSNNTEQKKSTKQIQDEREREEIETERKLKEQMKGQDNNE